MYTKLFEKILDSSVWLESATTRVVWITLLAAKNRDQVAPFAAVGNLARRAGVTLEEATEAVRILESPDLALPGQEHDGRRIARVDAGWYVINGEKYDAIKRIEDVRAHTRERVRRWREKNKVTPSNESDARKRPLALALASASDSATEKPEAKTIVDPVGPTTHSRSALMIELDWRIEQVWNAHLVNRKAFFNSRGLANTDPKLTKEIREAIREGLKTHDADLLLPDLRERWTRESLVGAAGIGIFLDPFFVGESKDNDINDRGKRYLEPWRPWKRQRGKADPIPGFAATFFERRKAS